LLKALSKANSKSAARANKLQNGPEAWLEALQVAESMNMLTQVDDKGRTPLMWAAYQGHVDSVRLLVRSGTERHIRLLMWASETGHVACMRWVVALGSLEGMSTMVGSFDCFVEFLKYSHATWCAAGITMGAEIDVAAVSAAMAKGVYHPDISGGAKLQMVPKAAKGAYRGKLVKTPASLAQWNPFRTKTTGSLVVKGGRDALGREEESIELYIEAAPDGDDKDVVMRGGLESDNAGGLATAATAEFFKAATALVLGGEAGSTVAGATTSRAVGAVDTMVTTLLPSKRRNGFYRRPPKDAAVKAGGRKPLQQLAMRVVGGPEIDLRDREGRTALALASMRGKFDVQHTACVSVLLTAGAAVEARDLQGMSPLHLAAKNGRADCARVLLRAGGADLHARVGQPLGLDGAIMTIDKNFSGDNEGFDQYGENYGRTPLMLAAVSGEAAAVSLLLGFDEEIVTREASGVSTSGGAYGGASGGAYGGSYGGAYGGACAGASAVQLQFSHQHRGRLQERDWANERTALESAEFAGHSTVAELLLRVTRKLWEAARVGDFVSLRRWLDQGGDAGWANPEHPMRWTALMVAANAGGHGMGGGSAGPREGEGGGSHTAGAGGRGLSAQHLRCVRMMLGLALEPNAANTKKRAQAWTQNGAPEDIHEREQLRLEQERELREKYGVDVDATDKYGRTGLLWLCRDCAWGGVGSDTCTGPDGAPTNAKSGHNARGRRGRRAREEAKTSVSVDLRQQCVEALLTAGANICATDNDGNTALMLAATMGRVRALPSILRAVEKSKRAELLPNEHEREESKAGVAAAEAAADARAHGLAMDFMNTQALSGRTALMQACIHGQAPSVGYLLRLGADPMVVDADGLDARAHALRLAAKDGGMRHGAIAAMLPDAAEVWRRLWEAISTGAETEALRTAGESVESAGTEIGNEQVSTVFGEGSGGDVDSNDNGEDEILARHVMKWLERQVGIIDWTHDQEVHQARQERQGRTRSGAGGRGGGAAAAEHAGVTLLMWAARKGRRRTVRALLKVGSKQWEVLEQEQRRRALEEEDERQEENRRRREEEGEEEDEEERTSREEKRAADLARDSTSWKGVDARDIRQGMSAMMWAACQGHHLCLQELLNAGADAETGAWFTKTVTKRTTAPKVGSDETNQESTQAVKVVEEEVIVSGGSEWTPLMWAAVYGHLECVKTLVGARAMATRITWSASAIEQQIQDQERARNAEAEMAMDGQITDAVERSVARAAENAGWPEDGVGSLAVVMGASWIGMRGGMCLSADMRDAMVERVGVVSTDGWLREKRAAVLRTAAAAKEEAAAKRKTGKAAHPEEEEAEAKAAREAVYANATARARERNERMLAAVSVDGKTALMLASVHGSVQCAALLIASGADLHALDIAGRTAADLAGLAEEKTMAARGRDGSRGGEDDGDRGDGGAGGRSGRRNWMGGRLRAKGKAKAVLDHAGPVGGGAAGSATERLGSMTAYLTQFNEHLWSAAGRGDVTVLKQWLRQEADMNWHNMPVSTDDEKRKKGRPTKTGRDGVAAATTATADGSTPLIYACKNGHLEVAAELLRWGAEVNGHQDKHGMTAIAWAAFQGHVKIVRLLMDGLDAMISATTVGNEPESATVVTATTAPAARESNVKEAGHTAVPYAGGVDTETAVPASGWTPLIFAASRGRLECVKVLVGKASDRTKYGVGATAGLGDNPGVDGAGFSCIGGRGGRGKYAELDTRDSQLGRSALMWAVDKGFVEVVRALVDSRADTTAVDNDGLSAAAIALNHRDRAGGNWEEQQVEENTSSCHTLATSTSALSCLPTGYSWF
jgi:ankyrin repeat protein